MSLGDIAIGAVIGVGAIMLLMGRQIDRLSGKIDSLLIDTEPDRPWFDELEAVVVQMAKFLPVDQVYEKDVSLINEQDEEVGKVTYALRGMAKGESE